MLYANGPIPRGMLFPIWNFCETLFKFFTRVPVLIILHFYVFWKSSNLQGFEGTCSESSSDQLSDLHMLIKTENSIGLYISKHSRLWELTNINFQDIAHIVFLLLKSRLVFAIQTSYGLPTLSIDQFTLSSPLICSSDSPTILPKADFCNGLAGMSAPYPRWVF